MFYFFMHKKNCLWLFSFLIFFMHSTNQMAGHERETTKVIDDIQKRKLIPLALSEKHVKNKEIPFDTCVLRDPLVHIGGLLIGGTVRAHSFIYCYSAEEGVAVLLPTSSRMLDFGFIFNFAYQSREYAKFSSKDLDGKFVTDIFGDYGGVTSGGNIGAGGMWAVYAHGDVVIRNGGYGGGFGFQFAGSVLNIVPRDPDEHCLTLAASICDLVHNNKSEDFPGIVNYFLHAITSKQESGVGLDANKLAHFDPAEFRDWRFRYVDDGLSPVPTPY